MKFLIATLLISASIFCSGQDIIGVWKTYDDESGVLKSKVKIYKKNGKIFGKIIELYNLEVDTDNPICIDCTDYRKDQPVRGMEIITGLVRDGDEWYADNAILDPKNGKIYDCKMWLVNKNKLAVRGYIGWFFRTQYWVRADH